MSKLEKYPAYKESGVEWLGEIPAHWEIKRIKAILQERKESNKPIKTSNILSLCMYRGVIPYSEKGNAGNKAKDDLTAYKLAYPGDIVLNSMNVIAGSVGLSKYFGAVSPVYYMLYPRTDREYIEFFNDIFQSAGFQKSLSGLGNGILIKKSESTGKLNTIRMRIPMDKLNNVLIPLPPKQEQIKIASFLDEKTSQLDNAIQQKEQLIKLLKERRQILINDAVTKGLDKTVIFKDSGVEWIGEIPEHWEVVKSKRLFMARKERARKSDMQLTASQKHGVIYQKDYMELEGRKVTQVETNYEILKRVEPNDFLISMRSFQGGIEYCRHEGSVSSAYVPLIPIKHVVSEYFKYLFKSYVYIEALASTSNLVRDGQALRFDNFSLVDLIIIPECEQENIANYLDEETAKIDKSIDLQQQQITKLKEYKATLIDSVVTGKVKVS